MAENATATQPCRPLAVDDKCTERCADPSCMCDEWLLNPFTTSGWMYSNPYDQSRRSAVRCGEPSSQQLVICPPLYVFDAMQQVCVLQSASTGKCTPYPLQAFGLCQMWVSDSFGNTSTASKGRRMMETIAPHAPWPDGGFGYETMWPMLGTDGGGRQLQATKAATPGNPVDPTRTCTAVRPRCCNQVLLNAASRVGCTYRAGSQVIKATREPNCFCMYQLVCPVFILGNCASPPRL